MKRIALLLSVLISQSASAYDWLQFGGDQQHSGNNAAEAQITPANVNRLGLKYSVTLSNSIDSAPVFLEAVSTPGGVKDLLFFTSTDGAILALDAQTGATVWSKQYGPGTCTTLNATACWTTSMPAVDPNRQYVYSYGLDGRVHKYQVGNGAEITTGGWPQVATLKPDLEKGTSALAIATSGGVSYLYAASSSYFDLGDYQGHVTAINLATGAQRIFNAACSSQTGHLQAIETGLLPTCPATGNSIWSRPGVVYDPGTNRIFVATSNGTYDASTNGYNWSESVLALNPEGTSGAGKPLDSFTPFNFQDLDDGDVDLGSTVPAILPVPAASNVQQLGAQGGKDGKLRLLNLANLSGQGGPDHLGGELQIIDLGQGNEMIAQPAVWVNPADGSTWVFAMNGALTALRLDIDGQGSPSLVVQWQGNQSGTSPLVANGVLYFLGRQFLYALNPVNGVMLWSSFQIASTHSQSMIVANGVVYAASDTALAAFAIPVGSTTTMLASSVNPSFVGQNVTFTATVTGNAPSGIVAFTADSQALCSSSVVASVATCSTARLTAGTDGVVATYGGDAANNASTSTALSQVVSSAPPAELVNPSFEIPVFKSGYQYNPSAPRIGWIFSANSGIQHQGKVRRTAAAPNGTQTAFINGTSTVSQALSLNAGSYTLSLQAAQRRCCVLTYVQPIKVTVDGTQIGSLVSPASTSFSSFSIPFSVATSGAHTLTFSGTDPDDKTTFIDAVTIQ